MDTFNSDVYCFASLYGHIPCEAFTNTGTLSATESVEAVTETIARAEPQKRALNLMASLALIAFLLGGGSIGWAVTQIEMSPAQSVGKATVEVKG